MAKAGRPFGKGEIVLIATEFIITPEFEPNIKWVTEYIIRMNSRLSEEELANFKVNLGRGKQKKTHQTIQDYSREVGASENIVKIFEE